MDELVRSLRRSRAVALLFPLFLVSGATGLVWQTVWERSLHLVLGTSTFATATVLSAFMAGLALGGAVAGARADRVARPLWVYGVLEVGIGAFAVVFPRLLDLMEPVYLGIWRTMEPDPVTFGAIQALLVGGLLVAPTAAMGATLPLLARFATDHLEAAGTSVGRLYAVNTLGAVVGTWLAGFLMLPGLGLATTTWIAAGANLALGIGAIGLSAWAGEHSVDAEPPAAWVPPDPRAMRAAVVAAGLAGCAALVLEVAWFRLLALMLGASAYAFSTMLLAFLVGIAAGGRLGGDLADRLWARGGVPAVLRGLAAVQLGVAVSAMGLMQIYAELPYWYVWMFDALEAADHAGSMWALGLLLAGAVMTVPATCMGVAFPLAVRAAVGGPDDVAGAVGRVYAANTAGGVVGAALAGFVLLPNLYVQGTVLLAVAVTTAAGAVAWSGQRGTWTEARGVGVLAGLLLIAVASRPTWDPMLMTAGMYKYVSAFEDHSRDGIRNYAVDQYELLYYREGLSSVVTVAANTDSGNRWLANNGKIEASTSLDMPTQVLVSLLPMQFVDTPDRALVIGLASGITAGAVSTVEDVQRLDVVELEPAIVEAARLFDPWNHGILDDPRLDLILDDGRNHVLRSAPGTYDVVVSEPSNPWITGVSNLFTREFFALGRSRLAEGGVWAQWVQLYGMDDSDLKSLLATFADVYPHVLCYTAAEDADLVLLGSDTPLEPTLARAARLRQWPEAAALLDDIGLHDAVDVTSHLLLSDAGVRSLAGSAPLNTDDNRRIEYRAPLHLHKDTQAVNLPLLRRVAEVPFDAVDHDPQALAELADAYHEREHWDRAIDTMLRAGLSLPDDDPRRAAWVQVAYGWYVLWRAADPTEVPDLKRLLESDFMTERVRPLLEEAG